MRSGDIAGDGTQPRASVHFSSPPSKPGPLANLCADPRSARIVPTRAPDVPSGTFPSRPIPPHDRSGPTAEDAMLDTKTTSFMRSLCMGDIEEDVMLPFPGMDPERRRRRSRASSARSIRSWGRERRTSASGTAPASCRRRSSRSCGSSASSAWSSPRSTAAWASGAPPTRARSRRSRSYDGSVAVDGRRAQLDRHARPAALRHRRAEGALPAQARHRRDDRRLLPHRAGRRLGRRGDQDHRGARRRRLGAQRREAVDHQRRHGELLHRLRQDRQPDERGKAH